VSSVAYAAAGSLLGSGVGVGVGVGDSFDFPFGLGVGVGVAEGLVDAWGGVMHHVVFVTLVVSDLKAACAVA